MRYHAVEAQKYSEETGHYTTYGIALRQNDAEPENTPAYLEDVFLKQEPVETLVEQLNRLQPADVHLHDVVEDAVAED